MLGRLLDIKTLLINVPITLIALTLHELAHGWVSGKLGDPTPKRDGRMTLNPMAHLDLVGTLLMILTGFGWAKPVMVNPMYYKDRKKGMALVGIAGPITNVLLAFVGMMLYALSLVVCFKLGVSQAVTSTVSYIAQLFVVRNLCFAVFNLIPIPPLDGSRVLFAFLPDRIYYNIMRYEQYLYFGLILLIATNVLDTPLAIAQTAVIGFFENIVSVPLNLIF